MPEGSPNYDLEEYLNKEAKPEEVNHIERREAMGSGEKERGEREAPIRTSVEIDVTRHGKKVAQVRGPEDYEVHLNTLGKLQALNKALEMGEMSEAMAKGSPRLRARETAGITALSHEIIRELGVSPDKIKSLMNKYLNKEELSAEESALAQKVDAISLESLEEKFAVHYQTQGEDISWIENDDRLDFEGDEGPVAKKENEVFAEGNLMPWMVQESDQMALDTKDKDATPYSVLAGNVAEILQAYVDTSDKLNKFVDSSPEQYQKISQDGVYNFRRIFGTHASIGESFLLKAMEKTQGFAARDALLDKIQNGFKEAEGFKFVVLNDGEKTEITVTLPERLIVNDIRELKLTKEMIDEIIAERDELIRKINS